MQNLLKKSFQPSSCRHFVQDIERLNPINPTYLGTLGYVALAKIQNHAEKKEQSKPSLHDSTPEIQRHAVRKGGFRKEVLYMRTPNN